MSPPLHTCTLQSASIRQLRLTYGILCLRMHRQIIGEDLMLPSASQAYHVPPCAIGAQRTIWACLAGHCQPPIGFPTGRARSLSPAYARRQLGECLVRRAKEKGLYFGQDHRRCCHFGHQKMEYCYLYQAPRHP